MLSPLFLALFIFAVTLILIFIRPRGIKEAWFAAAGALAALLFGLADADDIAALFHDTGGVLLFLAGLLVIAYLTDRAGVFERMARYVARAARGSGRRLFVGVYLIGLLVTVWLSLDTTAVILAPIVYNLTRLLGVAPLPFVFATTYVANTASLFLPVSNLTNLIIWGRFDIPFWEYAREMLLASVLAVVVNVALLLWIFRKEIPARFDPRGVEGNPPVDPVDPARVHGDRTGVPDELAPAGPDSAENPGHGARAAALTGRECFRFTVLVLGLILAGLVLAPFGDVELWVVACAGAAVLAAYHLARAGLAPAELVRNISWDLLPFVFSLFLILRAVAKAGLSQWAAETILTFAAGQSFWELFIVAATTALGSNLINNLPMILIATESLALPIDAGQLDIASLYAALIGTNLGPNLTVIGSLATMLSLSIIGKKGLKTPALLYFKVGLVSVPLLLLAAVLGLWIML